MDLWNAFAQSGKINDYLKYKKQEQEQNCANNNQGFNNQRADDRRE